MFRTELHIFLAFTHTCSLLLCSLNALCLACPFAVHLKCTSLTGPSKSFIFSVCKNNGIIVSQTKSEACTLEALCLLIMYISVYRQVQPCDSVVDSFKPLPFMLLQKQTEVKAGLQHIVGPWSLSAPYHVWLQSHSPTAGAE